MTEVDTVVKNAKIWITSTCMFEGGLAVNNGRVLLLAKDGALPEARQVIDSKAKVIVPGAIDGHVHIYEPWERQDKETWLAVSDVSHDTRAAAKSGTTTVLDHPVTQPLVLNREAFRFKRKIWEQRSYVDFGLHGGFVPDLDFKNIREMWEDGAVGFKTFMCFSTPEWPAMNNDGQLLEFLEQFARIKALPLMHAENDFIISRNRARLERAGRKDFKAHLDWRPPIAEIETVKRVCYYLTQTRSRGLFVHLSLPECVKEVTKARQRGYPVYAETCPQYLYLTSHDVIEKGPWRKCAPPLRDKDKALAMWNAVRNHEVDLMGSDHAPSSKEQKEAGLENIWNAPNGMPGIETFYPLMLSAVAEGKVDMGTVIRLQSENPARIYGLYPRKGNLLPGADADLVTVDVHSTEKISADDLEMKCGWTPYEGMTLNAVPVMTMIRGQVVMKDRKIVGEQGLGRFIPRLT